MSTLYARLKGELKDYRLIFDEASMPKFDFFPMPDISDATEYAPLATDTPKNAWFYVALNLEQMQEMVEPYLENARPDTAPINTLDYDVVDTIYKFDKDKVIFSKVGSSARIHETGKNILTFGEGKAELTIPSFGVDFSGRADAVYDSKTKRIYFQKIARARSIFKGIEIFYQDTTLDEKAEFLGSEMFALGNLNIQFISLANTLKLASINESQLYDFKDEKVREQVRIYANEYPASGVGVNEEGKIVLNNGKDLSATLKLLEQKFYTSGITGEKYEANKAKRMPQR